MLIDMINQPLLIFTHTEKIVGLFYLLRFGLMIGTFFVNQFTFHIETLAAETVQTFIFTVIDISIFIDLIQDVAHVCIWSGSVVRMK